MSPPNSPADREALRWVPHCPRCAQPLAELATSSEPEGIRKDFECKWCEVQFMCTKGGLSQLRRANKPKPNEDREVVVCLRRFDPERDNAVFIAHARSDIPWLLSQLESSTPSPSGSETE